MQVCVYYASSGKIHKDYFNSTDCLAKEFVNAIIAVVFEF
jgi:hypothetical protein